MSIEWDIEELSGYALGKSEAQVEEMINNSTCEDELNEKYGIDFATYCQIVQDLLPFTPVVRSPLTNKDFHAFVVHEKDNSRAILKQEATSTHEG